MSFALTLSNLVAPLVLGAPPAPCPEGQVPAPTAMVDGAAPVCVDVGVALPVVEPKQATADDLALYADLEQKTPAKTSDFRGGSTGVYVSTGAAIIIIVVLLIILL